MPVFFSLRRPVSALLAGLGVLAAAGVHAAPFAQPLVLAEEGMFFVNGKAGMSNYPALPASGAPVPGTVVTGQMYVHYRIPVRGRGQAKAWPIVMVHGAGLSGMSYETTPDGREGWATYFARKGFPTYVVDIPGRGRAGFSPELINQARYKNDASIVPAVPGGTMEARYVNIRVGAVNGQPYPGSQYPVEALDALAAQSMPGSDAMLPGASRVNTPPALAALLDRIGPAILMVHSQAGPNADVLVGLRPQLLKGIINVEGNEIPGPTPEQVLAYRGVPDLELFGDNVQGNPVSTGMPRYTGRKAAVEAINSAGGKARIVQLPELGMHGNTHMMMQDRNNLQIADWLVGWIRDNVK